MTDRSLSKDIRCKVCRASFRDQHALKQHNKAKHRIRGLSILALYFFIGVGLLASLAYSGVFTSVFATLSQPNDNEIIHKDVIFHIHPRLEIYIDGEKIIIPANIGIDPKLWKDRALERYGMPMPEMQEMPYMSPLHTHDNSGTIHLESTANRIYSLGEFFDVWGVRLNATCLLDKCGGNIIMTINGAKSEEFRNHILKDGEQIRVELKKTG